MQREVNTVPIDTKNQNAVDHAQEITPMHTHLLIPALDLDPSIAQSTNTKKNQENASDLRPHHPIIPQPIIQVIHHQILTKNGKKEKNAKNQNDARRKNTTSHPKKRREKNIKKRKRRETKVCWTVIWVFTNRMNTSRDCMDL